MLGVSKYIKIIIIRVFIKQQEIDCFGIKKKFLQNQIQIVIKNYIISKRDREINHL